jgi:hypothetical protein
MLPPSQFFLRFERIKIIGPKEKWGFGGGGRGRLTLSLETNCVKASLERLRNPCV